MVDNQQLDPDEEEEDGELPPYLNTEYLSTAVVPPLNGRFDTFLFQVLFRKLILAHLSNLCSKICE